MLSRKKYIIATDIAPVRISWSEEVVEDEDMGNFYVRLTPHVDWAADRMQEWSNPHPYDARQRLGYYSRAWKKGGSASTLKPGVIGAMKRSEIAEQGRKIFGELKKEWTADVQKKLRAQRNKATGQRWNKKV